MQLLLSYALGCRGEGFNNDAIWNVHGRESHTLDLQLLKAVLEMMMPGSAIISHHRHGAEEVRHALPLILLRGINQFQGRQLPSTESDHLGQYCQSKLVSHEVTAFHTSLHLRTTRRGQGWSPQHWEPESMISIFFKCRDAYTYRKCPFSNPIIGKLCATEGKEY